MRKTTGLIIVLISIILTIGNVYADYPPDGTVNSPTAATDHLGVDAEGNPALLPGTPTGENPGVIPPNPPDPSRMNKPFVPNSNNPMMEKCHVLDKDGNGRIKPYTADSGPNLEGDATAWIWVPRGQCARMNNGDFSGVSQDILNKINLLDNTNAQTFN